MYHTLIQLAAQVCLLQHHHKLISHMLLHYEVRAAMTQGIFQLHYELGTTCIYAVDDQNVIKQWLTILVWWGQWCRGNNWRDISCKFSRFDEIHQFTDLKISKVPNRTEKRICTPRYNIVKLLKLKEKNVKSS